MTDPVPFTSLRQFDPARDPEGIELWEIISVELGDRMVGTSFRRAEHTTYQQACACPWYYFVSAPQEPEEKPE